MVTICTTSLTFSNSTFLPHSVFMCFVWIWEQTAIISLYSINWLVCITETECVYCAVRTGCSIIIRVKMLIFVLKNFGNWIVLRTPRTWIKYKIMFMYNVYVQCIHQQILLRLASLQFVYRHSMATEQMAGCDSPKETFHLPLSICPAWHISTLCLCDDVLKPARKLSVASAR